ncbi:hypothetical protein SCA6_007828 [Theobroma cacao]
MNLSMYFLLFCTSLSFDLCSAGHAMWPEIVVGESLVGDRKGLSIYGGRSVPVQFFGTHDLQGILVNRSFQEKCYIYKMELMWMMVNVQVVRMKVV